MFRCPLDTTMCDLREKLCPPSFPDGPGGRYPGIAFSPMFKMANYRDDPKNGGMLDLSRFGHLVLCGNTAVFAATTEYSLDPFAVPVEAYAHLGTHDACWRDLVTRWVHQQYFDLAARLNAACKTETPPAKMVDLSRLNFVLYAPFELVTVTHAADGDGRRLVELTPRAVPCPA